MASRRILAERLLHMSHRNFGKTWLRQACTVDSRVTLKRRLTLFEWSPAARWAGVRNQVTDN
jgi:hypothetical protein